jgi:hypothetical protein
MKPSIDKAREWINERELTRFVEELDLAALLDRREREARVEELRWVSSDSTVSYEQIESRIRDLEAGK